MKRKLTFISIILIVILICSFIIIRFDYLGKSPNKIKLNGYIYEKLSSYNQHDLYKNTFNNKEGSVFISGIHPHCPKILYWDETYLDGSLYIDNEAINYVIRANGEIKNASEILKENTMTIEDLIGWGYPIQKENRLSFTLNGGYNQYIDNGFINTKPEYIPTKLSIESKEKSYYLYEFKIYPDNEGFPIDKVQYTIKIDTLSDWWKEIWISYDVMKYDFDDYAGPIYFIAPNGYFMSIEEAINIGIIEYKDLESTGLDFEIIDKSLIPDQAE
ncbi:hypothetical protein RI065_05695 [Mycoplasmatota bacterium zrk1]